MLLKKGIGRRAINYRQGPNYSTFLGIMYVSTYVILFDLKIRCQMFTLLKIASSCFLINPVIVAHTLPPPLLIANRHSVRYPHTMPPQNDGSSHGSCTIMLSM